MNVHKIAIGNSLVDGWEKFWGALGPQVGGISTLLAIGGGAIMAFFLVKWFWQKTRGGNGGNPMQGFPWWPMAVGLLLTAPTFLIPTVLRLVQVVINVVDVIFNKIVQTLGG